MTDKPTCVYMSVEHRDYLERAERFYVAFLKLIAELGYEVDSGHFVAQGKLIADLRKLAQEAAQ